MKKLIQISLMTILVALVGCCGTGCSKVTAGHVGVKVQLLGSSKGVESEEIGPGRYWISMNEELYIFPTFTQNYVWTANEAEGSHNNESLSFQTVEGMEVNADVGISYKINPDKVSDIFQKYRKGVEEITDLYLRNMVRDALVTAASTKKIESVYGIGKTELMNEVQESVRSQVNDIGIEVERIYWVGSLRLPTTVVRAMNLKIEATQKAQQRVNEVAQATAEADKIIEEARGKAESIRILATAEANAIQIKGDAIAKNPMVIELEAINQWDGVLPHYNGGGAVPFINVASTR